MDPAATCVLMKPGEHGVHVLSATSSLPTGPTAVVRVPKNNTILPSSGAHLKSSSDESYTCVYWSQIGKLHKNSPSTHAIYMERKCNISVRSKVNFSDFKWQIFLLYFRFWWMRTPCCSMHTSLHQHGWVLLLPMQGRVQNGWEIQLPSYR